MKGRPMAKIKDKGLREAIKRFEKEIRSLKDEVNKKEGMIDSLQKIVAELKKYQSYSKFEDLYYETTVEYEKEKDKLVKLHNTHNETTTKCKRLEDELKGWKEWYNYNKKSFDQLFSIASPRSLKKAPTEPVISKKRKKIKGKKQSK
jgi:alpha-L-arabinofuranosidase